MDFLHAVAAALYPHFCVGCEAEGSVLCAGCEQAVFTPAEPAFGDADGPLGGSVGFMSYADPAAGRLLRLAKYDRVDEALHAVARLFGAHAVASAGVLRDWHGAATVLPVPMHPLRERLRGFNQAVPLARAYAAALGLPYAAGVLGKRLRLKRQAELASAEERAANAAGAVFQSRRFVPGMRFLLVDDVLTTGATLRACADVLKRAGAGEVRAVTFLRG